MASNLDMHVSDNGLVLLGERMEAVESVAFGFMLPAGAAVMEEGCCGAANIISDWIFRGAGERDNRQLSDAMDGLGLHRSASVGSSHLAIGSTLEASNLSAAIDLYGDMILRPALCDEQFEPVRQLVIDGIHGLDDDPRRKVMLMLRERFYRSPLGRSTAGDIDQVRQLTAERVREIIGAKFDAGATIFSVAGKYDFDEVRSQVEGLFAGENAKGAETPKVGEKGDRYTHIANDGAQVHIGLMAETAAPGDADYYDVRVAVSVLSGGMSARLFTEVREKRGLCYAIGARYHGLKGLAGIMCYAGTTPEKAQETLDVTIAEFERLADGITEEEIHRAKVGLKSALIMQSESSNSRASGIASDYHLLGRVRSLDEIKEKIEATTVESVVECLKRRKFEDYTVVTIGPRQVEMK